MARREFPRLLRRVSVQVALFLSLALVPVGLLAVLQTAEVVRQAEQRSAASLVALTERAAEMEQQLIERAFGAAQGLGVVTLSAGTDTRRCTAIFRTFVRSNPPILSAALSDAAGAPLCGHPDPGDSGDAEARMPHRAVASEAARQIRILRPAVPDAPPRLQVRQTIRRDGVVQGHVHLTLTLDGVLPADPGGEAYPEILTVAADGAVLSMPRGMDDPAAALPAGDSLASLMGQEGPVSFSGRSGTGVPRQFAITPIAPDLLYAVGSWERRAPAAGFVPLAAPVPVFPLLMWLGSLAVAFFAVNRLMIRHIRSLQRSMRQFARARRLPPEDFGANMPAELSEIAATFRTMAGTVMRDEAELARNLHDREVLLKEVHHRVKNNLQLISSIMNMKARRLPTEEGRAVLRRLQDRVLSLAAIHCNLHEAGNLAQVDASTLLTDILRQLSALGDEEDSAIDLKADFAAIPVYPDQAVPLSLMASEAFTNAIKHLGSPDGTPPWMTATLTEEADGRMAFEVVNSTAPGAADGPAAEGGAGLGMKLIRAFCDQLGGTLEVEHAGGRHAIRCRFTPKAFDPGGGAARPMDTAGRLG